MSGKRVLNAAAALVAAASVVAVPPGADATDPQEERFVEVLMAPDQAPDLVNIAGTNLGCGSE